MTDRQAANILIKTARRELRRLAFNANLYDKAGINEPAFKKASRERRRLVEAIRTLTPPTTTTA